MKNLQFIQFKYIKGILLWSTKYNMAILKIYRGTKEVYNS